MCEFDFTLTPEKYLENALYYQKKDINLYFMNLTQSANLGYKDAIILLNREYLEHTDGDQIFNDQLIIFYKKTANMLLNYSLNYLGYMHKKGKGVKQDNKKAKELYERAIEKGNAFAMSNLAYMYRYGEGVEQNCDKAMELYYKAKNYSSCVALLIKNINNNKITTLQIEYLLKLDVNSLPNTLKLIQTLYKSKIELLELHFKYQPGEKGFLEAKKDFIRKSIKEY